MSPAEIRRLVDEYLGEPRLDTGRHASFDYCYNYFQRAREQGKSAVVSLAGDGITASCLNLGFYLASWGMYARGADVLQRSVRALIPVIQEIVSIWTKYEESWKIDLLSPTYATEIKDLCKRVRKAFAASGVGASDTLVTKTLLGVFGCVPAFDQYFLAGFGGVGSVSRPALQRIAKFYDEHRPAVDAEVARIATLDIESGVETVPPRQYPAAKIIFARFEGEPAAVLLDMVFFQKGSVALSSSIPGQRTVANDAANDMSLDAQSDGGQEP